jgi:hypothetical protein
MCWVRFAFRLLAAASLVGLPCAHSLAQQQSPRLAQPASSAVLSGAKKTAEEDRKCRAQCQKDVDGCYAICQRAFTKDLVKQCKDSCTGDRYGHCKELCKEP